MATRTPRRLTVVALPLLSPAPPSAAPLRPYLPAHVALHPKFLKPANELEKAGIVMGFMVRKWRYRAWDAVFLPFEDAVGRAVAEGRADPVSKATWDALNKATTRKGSVEEWVLRGIPAAAEEIVVEYPAMKSSDAGEGNSQLEGLNSTSNSIPTSIITPYLMKLASPPLQARLRTRLALNVLLVPFSLLLAKVVLPLAQLLLCYNLFGIGSSWRAVMGARRLEQLLRADRVKYVENTELGSLVSKELDARWAQQKQDDPSATTPGFAWGDLDRETVATVEKELKVYELGRTYERARRVGLWKGFSR